MIMAWGLIKTRILLCITHDSRNGRNFFSNLNLFSLTLGLCLTDASKYNLTLHKKNKDIIIGVKEQVLMKNQISITPVKEVEKVVITKEEKEIVKQFLPQIEEAGRNVLELLSKYWGSDEEKNEFVELAFGEPQQKDDIQKWLVHRTLCRFQSEKMIFKNRIFVVPSDYFGTKDTQEMHCLAMANLVAMVNEMLLKYNDDDPVLKYQEFDELYSNFYEYLFIPRKRDIRNTVPKWPNQFLRHLLVLTLKNRLNKWLARVYYERDEDGREGSPIEVSGDDCDVESILDEIYDTNLPSFWTKQIYDEISEILDMTCPADKKTHATEGDVKKFLRELDNPYSYKTLFMDLIEFARVWVEGHQTYSSILGKRKREEHEASQVRDANRHTDKQPKVSNDKMQPDKVDNVRTPAIGSNQEKNEIQPAAGSAGSAGLLVLLVLLTLLVLLAPLARARCLEPPCQHLLLLLPKKV